MRRKIVSKGMLQEIHVGKRRKIMFANWITNRRMKELLQSISNSIHKEEIRWNIQQMNKLFCPSFQKVKDCMIITEKNVCELEKVFDSIIETYTDKTGYEASNTETRINYYIENEISVETSIQIAFMVIGIWALRLKQLEPESKFCFIICSDEDFVEIRFHKVRDNENLWLEEDIESYQDEAIGYTII